MVRRSPNMTMFLPSSLLVNHSLPYFTVVRKQTPASARHHLAHSTPLLPRNYIAMLSPRKPEDHNSRTLVPSEPQRVTHLRKKRCTKMTCSVTELDTDSAVRPLKGLACLSPHSRLHSLHPDFLTPPSSSAHQHSRRSLLDIMV